MSVTVATLGFPRIGPRRELKTALERYWSGKSDRAELLALAADLRARTAAPAVGRRPRAQQRLLALRPCARHQRHGRRDPHDLRLDRRTAGRGHLFRDGAGRPGRGRARRVRPRPSPRGRRPGRRDDQVVRHQLPLPDAGSVAGPDFPARLHQGDRRVRRGQGAGRRHPAGAAGARDLPETGQEQGRGLRPAQPAGRPAAGLRDGAEPAGAGRLGGCRSTSRAWSPTSPTPTARPCTGPTACWPARRRG